MRTKEIAERMAQDFLNSEEGKEEVAKLNKEFQDFIVYGTPTRYLNEDLLTEIKNYETKDNCKKT